MKVTEFIYFNPATRSLEWFTVCEIDTDTYLVYTNDRKDYYGNREHYEFYARKNGKNWVTEPLQPADIVEEMTVAMKKPSQE